MSTHDEGLNQSEELLNVVLSIATFQRPEQLGKLLTSICGAQVPAGVALRCLIVDNDVACSARSVAATFADRLLVEYVSEPTPGIVAARNRGLDGIGAADAIVFVDDDEVVSERWLMELLAMASQTGADVVTGPVISSLPEGATRRQQRLLPFLQRHPIRDGQELRVAATNNTLLRCAAWRDAGCPRFDEAFSFTGGSDSAFFTRGHMSGWKIRHASNARVFEEVPADRLTFKWVSRRYMRVGNVLFRVRVIRGKRFPALGAALKYLGFGLLNAPVEALRRRGFPYRSVSKFYVGLGAISARGGHRVQEYRRLK